MFRIPIHRSVQMVSALVAIALMLGCGEGQFPVRAAKGKVVCAGNPVGSGSISFVPIGTPGSLETGKPASAAIGPDGNFVLSTFGRFDGAIVGKHRVEYVVSEGEESEEEENPDENRSQKSKTSSPDRHLKKQACVLKGELVVEVKATGENDFTIELSTSK